MTHWVKQSRLAGPSRSSGPGLCPCAFAAVSPTAYPPPSAAGPGVHLQAREHSARFGRILHALRLWGLGEASLPQWKGGLVGGPAPPLASQRAWPVHWALCTNGQADRAVPAFSLACCKSCLGPAMALGVAFAISARRFAASDTQMKGKTGTKMYMPPESLRGEPYGLEFDWWSFGVTMFELLCAEFPKTNAPELTFRDGVGAEARDLVTQLLDPDRETRLGVADEQAIRKHAYFADYDWSGLAAQTVKAPFIPDSKRANFDAHQDDIMAALDVNQAPTLAHPHGRSPVSPR